MPRRQKYSVASQTVRIPENAVAQVKHLCLILDGGGTVFAKAVVPTSEGASKLVEFSYSQQGVEIIAEHQPQDENEVERWVGELQCESEIEQPEPLEQSEQSEQPVTKCIVATAVAAVEAFLEALIQTAQGDVIANEAEAAVPVTIEIATGDGADAEQDVSGYFVTNGFVTNDSDDQLSDEAATFYVINNHRPCEPEQGWIAAARWEPATKTIAVEDREDRYKDEQQTTGLWCVGGGGVVGVVEDEVEDEPEPVAEPVAVTEAGIEIEVEIVSTDEAKGETLEQSGEAAVEDANSDVGNETLEVEGRETLDLSFALDDSGTEMEGDVREEVLGKSTVDLEELQQFAVRIFESWKALSRDVWGQPVALEAVYDQGFRSMLVLSFLSQLGAVHEQQIDTVWGRLILTKRSQDGDLLKVGKQLANGLTFTKIIKPKQPVPQGRVTPQPQWDKSGHPVIPGFVPLKMTDTFSPPAESNPLKIGAGLPSDLLPGFVTILTSVTKPIADPVTKPETVADALNEETTPGGSALENSNKAQPDLQNVPTFLRQLRQRKKT